MPHHLSPGKRGYDKSMQPANLVPEVDAREREKLGMMDNIIPLCKCELPGLDHAYGPSPPAQTRSLVSRSAVWIPTEGANSGTMSCGELGSRGDRDADPPTGDNFVKKGPWSEERITRMKDAWRFLSDSPDVAGGDLDGASGRTQMQESVDAPLLCERPRIFPYQHYRLVHGIVGRPLLKFGSTKRLVAAVSDAVQGACPSKYTQTVR